MNPQLRCLVVEDDPVDFQLLDHHLRSAAPDSLCRRVERLADLQSALAQGGWDIILSDYIVPGLEFPDTLAFLQAHHPGLPLILVSGTVGEERTVELLRLGVADFVLKGNLVRLLPAIERSLRDAAGRRERLAAEERYRSLFDHLLNGCAYCQMIFEGDQPRDFIYLAVNHAFAALTGLAGVLGRRVSEVIPGIQATTPGMFVLFGRVARTRVPEKSELYVEALEQWFDLSVYSPAPDHFVVIFDVITERKQAEEALKRSQAVYHSLVTQLPVGIYQKDRDGRYVVVNPTLCQLRGLPAAAFLGKSALEVAAAENSKLGPGALAIPAALAREDHHRQIMESGQPIEMEEEFILADGRRELMHVMKLPVLDLDGQVIGTQGVLFSITARQQAEAALRQSELFKQAILDSVDSHIAVVDPDGVILAVNARWQDFARANSQRECQPPPNTGPGVNYLEICRRSNRPDALAVHDGIVAVTTGRQESFSLEYRCDSPHEKRWFNLVVTRLGPGPQAVVSHTNITERKWAEELLRESEAQFRAIFETAMVGIAQAEPSTGQLRRVNRKMCAITGYSAEELLRLRVPDITHPEDRLQDWDLFQAVIRGESPHYRVEKRYLRKDGRIAWVNVNMTVLRDAAGQPVRTLAVIEDITERRLAEQALRASELAFRTLAESLPQIVWSSGPDGLNNYFNQHWTDYTGRSSTQNQDHSWNVAIHPEELPAARRTWKQAVQLGSPYAMECRLRRADGVYRWWLTRAVPLLDDRGEILKWFGTCTDIDDLKRAEAALRTSRAKLGAALASMTDAVFISDARGDFLEFNEAFATFHKFRSKTECFQRLTDYPGILDIRLPHGEPVPVEMWAVPRALRGETCSNVEYTIRRKDTGESWYCSCSFSPIRDATGAIVGAVVVARDVTERKQAEQTLRLTQFSLEHSSDAIWWLAPDGRFLRANPAASRLVGYTLDEIQTLYAHDLNPAHPPGAWAQHWQELRQEKVLKFEAPARTKDGRLLTVEVTANYLEFEGQEFNCAFVHDITERKAKTQELLWKTAFLEALVHSSADGILVVDDKGHKILQNQKVIDIWGVPPEIANHPDDRKQFEFARGQVLNPEQFQACFLHFKAHPDELGQDEIELKNGTVLERHSAPVRGHDGRIYGRLWTFHDITRARQLEAQYRQAQKMEAIGTLAGGIAHDFNNILCAMFGYGYLAQQELAPDSPAWEYLGEILKSASRAKDLVQQILTFSRQREQKQEVIGLATVIKEVAKFLRASLPADLRIEINLDDQAPAVLADPTQIYQVVMNLATNALHAMEGRPGCLMITLADFAPDQAFRRAHPQIPPNRYTRLTVADTGHGMDERTLERIFEPFFTTKEVGKGTGLGLAVVHGIVQAHDAFLTVASQPGQGTTFDLFFPAQKTAPTPENSVRQIPRGEGQRILLLDDEPALTGAFQGLLERLNYRVITCNLPSEALRLIQADPAQFDLVITDLTMPEMSGFDLTRHLHGFRPNLPVILATGNAHSVTAATLQDAGILELLAKPLVLGDLALAVQRALALK